VKLIFILTQVFVVAVNDAVGLGVISIFFETISETHPFLEVTFKVTG
jgi:hypothetical protein